MKIVAVEAIPVSVPRTKPMISAGGPAALTRSEFGVLRVMTDKGIEGIGEISMNFGRNGAEQCRDVQGIVGPALLGLDPRDIRACLLVMDRVLPQSEPAKAGIEIALFDILGKALEVPVYRLLGGKVRESVPVRWGLGFGPPEAAVEELGPWVARGFRTAKIKVGRSGTGLDLEMVRAVRTAFGEELHVMVDANGAYMSPLEAIRELSILEGQSLQLIEQPLPRQRLEGLALVRRGLRTPIVADESMRHFEDAYFVARASAADVLSIYVCEVGGLLAAAKAFAIAEAAGLPCLIGSQCELGIGTVAMAHLAVCMSNLAYESDITGHLRYPADVIQEKLTYESGAIRPPDDPGLGVTLDLEAIARFRIDN